MPEKFEQFTDRARKVLTLAQEEAHRFNHQYIGTEHLLLGLLREGEGVAAQVLSSMGVTLPKVRQAIEHIVGRGQKMVVGEIGLTPRAKQVMELAVQEARRHHHHYIGTEHLLLGLLDEGEGVAAGVLESLGVSLVKVHSAIEFTIPSGVSMPRPRPEPLPPHRRNVARFAGMPAVSAPRVGLLAAVAGIVASLLIEQRPRLLPSLLGGILAGAITGATGIVYGRRPRRG